jgi:gamma-glutamyltranspeptidase
MKRADVQNVRIVDLLLGKEMRKSNNVEQIGWKANNKTGIVAAGGAQAVAAGISILEQDGNAADAATATLLA